MKKNFFTLFLSLNLFAVNPVLGNAGSGLDSVSIQAITDEYGYEGYWELVPGTNTCETEQFSPEEMCQIGCNGGGNQSATSGTDMEICKHILKVHGVLPDGATYTIHFVDDYGDGGTDFVVCI